MLIELSGDAETMEAVRVEVQRSLGSGITVKKVENMAPIEIRDLDAETTKEELAETISSEYRVVSLRKAFGGTQTAIVVVPNEVAKRLCGSARLRVGLVYARVRPTELQVRCFRCLGLGHVARACSGVNRSSCCLKCSNSGHFSRECAAEPEKIASFRRTILNAEGSRV